MSSTCARAPRWRVVGRLAAWGASLAAGAAFFRWLEVPLGDVIQAASDRLTVRLASAQTPGNAVHRALPCSRCRRW
ncbi:hypothetical protein CD932_03845 [Janthinobacterium sp. PC23-8]|nr:hypothetical protein CD932_03845 [Janthinobacterium sp. PC23-8]